MGWKIVLKHVDCPFRFVLGTAQPICELKDRRCTRKDCPKNPEPNIQRIDGPSQR